MTESFEARFWRRVVKMDVGCWLWTGPVGASGYGTIQVVRGANVATHRLSYEMHVGAIPDGMLVCHRCDIRRCVAPHHLFLGTHRENMADMVAKGRSTRGRRNPSAKLTEEQVIAIRNAYAAGGVTHRELGAAHEVSESLIARIVRGDRWRELRGPRVKSSGRFFGGLTRSVTAE